MSSKTERGWTIPGKSKLRKKYAKAEMWKAEMWKAEMSDLKSVGIKYEQTKKGFALEL